MKNKRGIFIVLDGIDGAGKTTQTKLLLEKLKNARKKTATLDFPRYYNNFFGEMTGEYLSGKFGNNVDPKLASVLYALDRWESKDFIEEELRNGKIFVCNRYMSANMIHQGGRIKGEKNKEKMMEWLQKMEFDILKIPKPDIVIYLDVKPETGQKLVDKKSLRAYNSGKKRDLHERDIEHLKNARKQALRLTEKNKNWEKIDCTDHGKMLKPEIISDMIWEIVKEKIK